MATPCVLVASCSKMTESELVRRILAVDELPESVCVEEHIVGYPWTIETKYFTANVHVCIASTRQLCSKVLADAIQAFVVAFDSTNPSSFQQVAMWLPYLKELSPAVQLLLCESCADEDAVPRNKTLGWCLDNGFELVELNPAVADHDSDCEDDFKETVGIQRIIEALSCHSWSNMVLKEKPNFRSKYFQDLMNDAARENSNSQCADSNREEGVDVSLSSNASTAAPAETAATDASNSHSNCNQPNHSTNDLIDTLLTNSSELAQESSGSGEAASVESFEKLFNNLHLMKDATGKMSTDERRKYAEQVTMQFWEAIGGNSDEFEGLSDSDSD